MNLASGILVTCTCEGENFIIFGLSRKNNRLCNFHGMADKDEVDPKTTALREYAEESLNAICEHEKVVKCLKNEDFYRMILPLNWELTERVKCYWVHLGTISKQKRIEIKERFEKTLKDSKNLTLCQKEIKELVFVNSKEVRRLLGTENYSMFQFRPPKEKIAFHPTLKDCERKLSMRRYIQQYIHVSFDRCEQYKSSKDFTLFCEGNPSRIKCILDIDNTTEEEEEKDGET